jgi:hypothetical protein
LLTLLVCPTRRNFFLESWRREAPPGLYALVSHPKRGAPG